MRRTVTASRGRRAKAMQTMTRRDAIVTALGAGTGLLLGQRSAPADPAQAGAEIERFSAGIRGRRGASRSIFRR
jgi:hypothetical protein